MDILRDFAAEIKLCYHSVTSTTREQHWMQQIQKEAPGEGFLRKLHLFYIWNHI